MFLCFSLIVRSLWSGVVVVGANLLAVVTDDPASVKVCRFAPKVLFF